MCSLSTRILPVTWRSLDRSRSCTASTALPIKATASTCCARILTKSLWPRSASRTAPDSSCWARYPRSGRAVLRIFAADRQRLRLLRGRLGPFELFQTLTYPIDPQRLIATLALAVAAQNADADTSDIQHVELSGEAPAQGSDEAEEPVEFEGSVESEEPEHFPAPRPAARVAPMEQAQAASGGRRAASRSASAHQSRSTPGQRPRGNGAAGTPTVRAASGSSGGRSAASGASSGRGNGSGLRSAGPRDGMSGPRGLCYDALIPRFGYIWSARHGGGFGRVVTTRPLSRYN